MAVVKVLALLFLITVVLLGDTFKLYLKEGGFHVVREYKVEGDRVRYFSTERGDWEEIPVDLVDLKKTEAEHKATQDIRQRESRQLTEEDQAERAQRKELASIPLETGGYYLEQEHVRNLSPADYKVVTDKKRQALKYVSPIPIIAGRASVEIEGSHAKFIIQEDRPTFYMRLDKIETFGIIKLTPKKTARIVENISIIPVANQNVEEQKQVETFQQQMDGTLFKVWPEKALEPGEYALVEFTQGEINLQIWDFAYRPTTDSKK